MDGEAKARLEHCASENQTSLDLSGLRLGAASAREVASRLPSCGALTKLIFGGDAYNGKYLGGGDYERITPEPAVLEVGMKEADLSNKGLQAGGAIIVGAWISNKDNGALTSLDISNNKLVSFELPEGWIPYKDQFFQSSTKTFSDAPPEGSKANMDGIEALADAIRTNGALTSLNVSANSIPVDEMKKIIGIAKSMPAMKTLCEVPFKDKTITELDLSEKNLGADGAIVVSYYIHDNGTLVKFTFSGQVGRQEGPPVTMEASMVEADFSRKKLGVSGAIMLAAFLPKCQALEKLLMGANEIKGADAGKAFGDAIASNTVLKELDLSGRQRMFGVTPGCDVEFVKTFSAGLGANGALKSLNLASNRLEAEGAKYIAEAIKGHGAMAKLTFSGDQHKGYGYLKDSEPVTMEVAMVQADFSNKGLGASGAIMLAAFLPKCQAVEKFDISNNDIRRDGAKALAGALKDNQVMKELNIACNNLYHPDLSGVVAISDAIPTMGALETLDISSNNIGEPDIFPQGWTKESNGYFKDPQGKWQGTSAPAGSSSSGVQAIAEAIKYIGALLVSANLLNNKIGVEQAQNLATILKAHATLKSLCGNKGDETELDMSGKEMGADGAVMLAPEIVANGALENLNISNNNIPIENMNEIITLAEAKPTMKVLCAVPFRNKAISELDVSNRSLNIEGALVISHYLEKNGTLSLLDLSCNSLGDDGVTAIIESISEQQRRGRLNGLTHLRLNNNEISLTGLRRIKLAFEHNLDIRLDLEGNNFEATDLAEFKQHRENLVALFAQSCTVPLRRCKIYLVGWGGTGKTTLRRALKRTRGRVPLIGKLLTRAARLEADRENEPERETVGVEIQTIKIGGEEFSLWDYGGQVEYYTSYDLFLPTHNAIFLVLSSLAARDEEEREAQLRFWMSFIKSCTLPSASETIIQKPTIIMIGSRADQVAVTDEYLKLTSTLRSEFESALRISPMLFPLDCRDDSSAMMAKLQMELVRMKKAILNANAHRLAPQICEQIRIQLPILRQKDKIMAIEEFIAFSRTSARLGPQWTDKHIKTAMLHLHDEGEITYRAYFSCVLLDPTWLCSTVMGRILSSDVQYQQRRQSFRPSARFTIEQIGEVAEIESRVHRSFVAELLESLCFCVKEEDSRYLFPARLSSSAHHVLDEQDLWTSPESDDAVYIGRRIASAGTLADFFTPGLFPRLQLALRALSGEHCKLWRGGLQMEKYGAVARVESVVVDWHSGHPQAIDACIRAQAAGREQALVNGNRLVDEIIECIRRVCERYAPGLELREPEAVSIRALWQIDTGEDRCSSRKTIPIHELEAMQNQDEIYWGQERVDELLGHVAITKRTTAASEPDFRAQNKELARIQEQPVMRDYYQFMRMRLRSYFDAVSALRSGEVQTNLSFTHWTKDRWVGNGLKHTLRLLQIPVAGTTVKAGFDFVVWREKSARFQNACRYIDLLANPREVAEATARAMALRREEQLQHIAHAEPSRWSRMETTTRDAIAHFFVEDDDSEVKRLSEVDCRRMIDTLQGGTACPKGRLKLSLEEARNSLVTFATDGGRIRLTKQRTGGDDGSGGGWEQEEEDSVDEKVNLSGPAGVPLETPTRRKLLADKLHAGAITQEEYDILICKDGKAKDLDWDVLGHIQQSEPVFGEPRKAGVVPPTPPKPAPAESDSSPAPDPTTRPQPTLRDRISVIEQEMGAACASDGLMARLNSLEALVLAAAQREGTDSLSMPDRVVMLERELGIGSGLSAR